MFNIFINGPCTSDRLCVQAHIGHTVKHMKEVVFSKHDNHDSPDCFVLTNGHLASDHDVLHANNTYHIIPRLHGGKGGFGSMLRALGAQIEKTTNHEACRDLSGRRMRDVNNEKKLKEWVAKKADMEREREEKKREKRARVLRQPMHKFEDPAYHEQKSKVMDNLEDALSQGLKKSGKNENGTRKRKAESTVTSGGKKSAACFGFDMDEIDSDSDSDASSDSTEQPIIPLEADISTSNDSADSDCQPSTSSQAIDSTMNSKDCEQSSAIDGDSNEASSSTRSNEGEDNSPSSSVDDAQGKRDSRTVGGNRANTEGQTEGSSTVEQSDTTATSTTAEAKVNEDTEPIDLEDYTSARQLEELGLDRLKTALMTRGLKCGGTLQQRAERLFSVKGLSPDQIDKSLLAKPSKGKKK